MALNFDSLFRITAQVRGEQQIDNLNRKLSGLTTAAGAASRVMGVFGVALSAAAIVTYSKTLIDAGDALWTMHERTGVAVEDLSKFQGAAEQTGTSLESVAKGLTKLNRSIGLRDKNADIMKQLGIDVTNATTAMLGLADVMQKTEDPALKAALAMQLFGKNGAELVPLLSQGRAEIEGMATAITSDFAQASDEFNDSLNSLKRSSQSLATEGLLPVVTALADVAKGFALVEEASGGGNEGYGVFDLIGDAVRVLSIGINTLLEGLKQVYFFLRQIAAAAEDVARGDWNFSRLGYWQGRSGASFDNHMGQTNAMLAGSKAFNGDALAARREEEARAAAYEKLKAGLAPSGGPSSRGGRGKGNTDWVLYQMEHQFKPDKKDSMDKKVKKALNELGPDSFERALQQNQRAIEQMRREAETIGLSTLERERAAAIAELEAAGIKEGTKAYQDRLAAVDALHRANFDEYLRDTTRSLQEEIDALQFEIDMWGKSREEIERATIARKYDVMAQNMKIGKTEEEQRAIDALIAKYKELALQQQQVAEDRRGDWLAGAKKGLQDYLDTVTDVAGQVSATVGAMAARVEDAMFDLFSTGKLNFKAFISDILKELLRLWIRVMIMKPLLEWIKGMMPGSGGGGGGGLGGLLSGLFGGGRALGGSVAGGRTHLVGENGPELFTPAQSGRITPNNRLGGGGDVSVVVNVNSETGQTTTSGNAGDAARLGKLIGAKVREVIVQEKRVGGMLAGTA